MACLLKAMDDSGMIKLRRDHADFRGNNPLLNNPPKSDGATAYDNIRDACDGKPALTYCTYTTESEKFGRAVICYSFRSPYGTAPEGCICLDPTLLNNLHEYAIKFLAEQLQGSRFKFKVG